MARTIVELYHKAAKPLSYSPWCKELANIPGLVWNRKAGQYEGYPDAIEAFARRIDQHEIARRWLCLVDRRTGALDLTPNGFDKVCRPLREYQRDGVKFLVNHAGSGAFLADDVGLGKSAQAIHAMRLLGVKKALIVCPAVVKHVWWNELKKWWARSTGYVVQGTHDPLPSKLIQLPRDGWDPSGADILIANYEIIHAYDPPVHEKIDCLIIDEGHYLQDQRSRRSQAVQSWAEQARYRIMLSATPMNARERDLFNPVNTISPGRFGFFHGRNRGFADVYGGAHQETIDKFGTTVWKFEWPKEMNETEKKRRAAAAAELNLRLSHFMLRRTKQEVMTELPPRQRHLIDVDVPDWSRVAVEWDDQSAARKALDLSGQGKIPHASALVTDLTSYGKRTVIFTHRRETAVELGLKLKAPVVTGANSVASRHKLVAARPSVLIATMDSLGVGIDLTYWDTLVFVDLDWLPSKLIQLEGRLHRFGQTSNIDIYYLIGKGTLDERVRSVVLERLEMYERVLSDKTAADFKGEMEGTVLPRSEEELLREMREMIISSDGEESAVA